MTDVIARARGLIEMMERIRPTRLTDPAYPWPPISSCPRPTACQRVGYCQNAPRCVEPSTLIEMAEQTDGD